MENSIELTQETFMECNWSYDSSSDAHNGYSSVTQSLENHSKKMLENGSPEHSKIMSLLALTTSMRLEASSINEPFKTYFKDIQTERKYVQPDDFTEEHLIFFEKILDDVQEPWLKARLADLLWLLRKQNKVKYAKVAIDSYIFLQIDDKSWHRGVKDCWERAARLSMQINDSSRLETIKDTLLSVFFSEYPESKFMNLWVAELLDKLKIDKKFSSKIASSLSEKANSLKEKDDFHSARAYFELASQKYKQSSNESEWLESLITRAECFELEAASRASESNFVAHSFYQDAIEAYRLIPTKYRNGYCIEEKIKSVRDKLTASGKASIEEMSTITTPGIDVSAVVKESVEFVSGISYRKTALMHFTGLFGGPVYEDLSRRAKDKIPKSFLSNLFGSSYMSNDGRVIAKSPAIDLHASENDPSNQIAIKQEMVKDFSLLVELVVEAQILPALRQILMEHRFTKDFIVTICHYSSIVPRKREELLGYALWLGFEYEFGAAIHLLCPQFEHIVRSQLKESGAHTSNIKDGIEQENGLSTLMELPEATALYGEDLTFEIKSVFTDSLGFNLRNEVAHGLLNDISSFSVYSVYAWWMVLRMILNSVKDGVPCDQ